MKGNAKEKIIILTDIHGCLEEMNTLLSKVEFDEIADMLIILGDTMDRGRDSYGVYLRLMTLKSIMMERCVLIRGNHEQMLLDAMVNPLREYIWYGMNGGDVTAESFQEHDKNIKDYASVFEQFCLYYETNDFVCAHAGIALSGPKETAAEVFLWDRSIAEGGFYSGKLFIYGHTPMQEALYQSGDGYGHILKPGIRRDLPKSGSICLDTGCVFEHKLTGMVIFDDGKFLIESVAKV